MAPGSIANRPACGFWGIKDGGGEVGAWEVGGEKGGCCGKGSPPGKGGIWGGKLYGGLNWGCGP